MRFWLPLYSAKAPEALAERLGLLLTALCGSEMKFLHIPYGLTANVTKHDMYEPVDGLWERAYVAPY